MRNHTTKCSRQGTKSPTLTRKKFRCQNNKATKSEKLLVSLVKFQRIFPITGALAGSPTKNRPELHHDTVAGTTGSPIVPVALVPVSLPVPAVLKIPPIPVSDIIVEDNLRLNECQNLGKPVC